MKISRLLPFLIMLPLSAAGVLYIYEEITLRGDTPHSENTAPAVTEQTVPSEPLMLSHGNLSDYTEAALPELPPPATGGACPYPTDIEDNDGAIEVMAYGKSSGERFITLDGGAQVQNLTALSAEQLLAESRLLPEFSIDSGEEPQVLIMHTHTTESYEPYSRTFYDSSFNSRTTDESMNMVAVGNEIERQLTAAGIAVIHDRTIHDYPSYSGSYDRSAVTVKAILEQYPTIKVVLDVHRDAIERNDGTRIAPSVEIDGRQAAQVMIISGCDDGTLSMPDYMLNFRFSCLLQRQMESDYPGLTRPILFDYRRYNQDLTTGSILIEVGGHANSIDEAKYAGELVGRSLSRALLRL